MILQVLRRVLTETQNENRRLEAKVSQQETLASQSPMISAEEIAESMNEEIATLREEIESLKREADVAVSRVRIFFFRYS